ncbi:MAG: hypothetical protein ACT4P5_17155 [Armatimonadota bacterium]
MTGTPNERSPDHQPGRWRVHPWNFRPEVQGTLAPAGQAQVFVVDSTIRSICTSEPGTNVTPADLVDIAAALADIGVVEAVFNIHHDGEVSELTVETARAVRRAGIPLERSAELHVTPPNWRELLDLGISLEMNCLQVAYGATGIQPGFTGAPSALALMEQCLDYLQERGQAAAVAYNVHAHDDLDFFLEYMRRAVRHSVKSIRVYDTTAGLSPAAMRWLITVLKQALPKGAPPVVVHTHDTWGLASAGTIEAVLGGADGVDIVVNGLGTKGGHTPLAETVLALEGLYGVRTGIRLEKLVALSRLVSERTGVPIPRVMPAVGPDVFLAEQGGQVMKAYRERDSGVEDDVPWAPSVTGLRRRVVYGRNTLKRRVLRHKLQCLGIEPTEERIDQALADLKERLAQRTAYPIWLEEDEVDAILADLSGRPTQRSKS